MKRQATKLLPLDQTLRTQLIGINFFPAAAENAAKNCALTDVPIDDEPLKKNRIETKDNNSY